MEFHVNPGGKYSLVCCLHCFSFFCSVFPQTWVHNYCLLVRFSLFSLNEWFMLFRIFTGYMCNTGRWRRTPSTIFLFFAAGKIRFVCLNRYRGLTLIDLNLYKFSKQLSHVLEREGSVLFYVIFFWINLHIDSHSIEWELNKKYRKNE